MSGLHYPATFLASLPVLLARPAPHAPIRALTAAQFAKIRHLHLTADVPDSVLFPFLHGLEGDNQAQNLFFAKHRSSVAVPDYRGLVWVLCDDELPEEEDDEDDNVCEDGHARRRSDASSSSSAESLFSQSVSSLSTAATSIHTSCAPKPSHLLTSAFRPTDLLTTSPAGPVFIPPAVPKGISLRNFGIQVPIYATLSDIVVYAPQGPTRAAFALAERLKLAIEAKATERGTAHGISYNVFLVSDPFSTFERDFPDLVAVTSAGVPVNHTSFPEREMHEMHELTRASEIHPGVFLGNSADVPLWEPGDPEQPFDAVRNPHGYDICVECHDQAPFPHAKLLAQAEDHLDALDALWATRYTRTVPRPPPNPNTIIHFSFPAAPPAVHSTLALLSPFLHFLQNALHRSRPARILIYSHDGYTESSVLALALLIAEKHCSLPEAYLELQVTRGRSFFVHQCDLGVLRRVEARYAGAGADRKESGKDRWGWSAIMARSHTLGRASSPPSPSAPSASPAHLSTSIPTPAHPDMPHRRARAQTSPLLPALVDHQSWFNDIRFDGSFPSRVLPFLYLGNLNHASNAYMLHALGITHVVSVGECALVPPMNGSGEDAYSMPEYQVVHGNGTHGTHTKESGMPGSLWKEEREGRIKVLDIKGVCDDGIDSLRPTFVSICDWIDAARREGGQVLVHCRVGVSRSATVTIAYVMKHLSLSLVDAYLIVRSRRLSVLIQPNMRLLYNLCGWELELARERVAREREERRKGRLGKGRKGGRRLKETDVPGEKTSRVQEVVKEMNGRLPRREDDVEVGNGAGNGAVEERKEGDAERDGCGERDEVNGGDDDDGDDVDVDGDDDEEEKAMGSVLKKSLNWPYLAREVHLLNEKYLH